MRCLSTKKAHLAIRRYNGYKTRTYYVLINYIRIGLSGQKTKVNTDYSLNVSTALDIDNVRKRRKTQCRHIKQRIKNEKLLILIIVSFQLFDGLVGSGFEKLLSYQYKLTYTILAVYTIYVNIRYTIMLDCTCYS